MRFDYTWVQIVISFLKYIVIMLHRKFRNQRELDKFLLLPCKSLFFSMTFIHLICLKFTNVEISSLRFCIILFLVTSLRLALSIGAIRSKNMVVHLVTSCGFLKYLRVEFDHLMLLEINSKCELIPRCTLLG